MSRTLTPALLAALALLLQGARAAPRAPVRRFVATLSGAEEVPPVVTPGFGRAEFRLDEQRRRLGFDLFVENLRNITAAHIHLGRRGENGPIVAFLFGPVPGGVDRTGRLSSGTITAADLVGPLEGASFSALVAAMRQGNTYVNVHTRSHPEGEIRGQIGAAPRLNGF